MQELCSGNLQSNFNHLLNCFTKIWKGNRVENFLHCSNNSNNNSSDCQSIELKIHYCIICTLNLIFELLPLQNVRFIRSAPAVKIDPWESISQLL